MPIIGLFLLVYLLAGVVAMAGLWLDSVADDDRPRIKILTLLIALAVSPLWPFFVGYKIKHRKTPPDV